MPDSERVADREPFAVGIAIHGPEHVAKLDAAVPVGHVLIAVVLVEPAAVADAVGVALPVPDRLRLGQPVGVPDRPGEWHRARRGYEPRPRHEHGPRRPDRQHELLCAGSSDRRDVRTHGSAAARGNLTPGANLAPGGNLTPSGKLADDGKRAPGGKLADDGKRAAGD